MARQGRRDSDKVSRNRQAPPPASLIRAPMPDRVDFELVATMRREHVLLAHADTFLEANDRIGSIASPAAQKALAKYLGPTSQIEKNGIQIPLSDLAA